MGDQNEKKKALLAPLEKDAYEQATAPSAEAIRTALKHGAEVLRETAVQPKPPRVDPKIRFR